MKNKILISIAVLLSAFSTHALPVSYVNLTTWTTNTLYGKGTISVPGVMTNAPFTTTDTNYVVIGDPFYTAFNKLNLDVFYLYNWTLTNISSGVAAGQPPSTTLSNLSAHVSTPLNLGGGTNLNYVGGLTSTNGYFTYSTNATGVVTATFVETNSTASLISGIPKLNGSGTNTTLVNLNGINNQGILGIISSATTFNENQYIPTSSTITYYPGITLISNATIQFFFTNSTFSAVGPDFFSFTCPAAGMFNLGGYINYTNDPASPIQTLYLSILSPEPVSVFYLTSHNGFYPINISFQVASNSTVSFSYGFTNMYEPGYVPGKMVFSGFLSSSVISPTSVSINATAAGPNALEVNGIVDSTVGFTVNGVPISTIISGVPTNATPPNTPTKIRSL